ncbi:hypothetical protein J2X12_001289 [Pseudarthrobacter oxydans]|uniref:Uncharacterized protein n=1 Tax=Pseudarthrobacter oxydans TaxID=1671 RepID=A0AAW8N758_PSEOX|nr:hypothetical protein [Pseudarthrobacter oxydans]MDR6791862.1 hypothetical protein [Pseudarthrobacter oxydans]MDR7163276.1 hypothetical protein [Pseudarthrobacter oxydans]
MESYRLGDWCRLIGIPVEVRKDFELVRSGVVDDAMEDSSALWIAADASGGRALFAAAEGYEVWIRPRELEGRLCYKMAVALRPLPAGAAGRA